MTIVVNLYKEEYDVYIGRPGKGVDGYFGNPFPVGKNKTGFLTLEESLQWYKAYLEHRLLVDEEFKQKFLDLKGKRLGCFCKPKPCHGDVIVEVLERMLATGQ